MYEPLETRKIWARFAEDFGAAHSAKGVGNQFDFYDQVVYRHRGLKITLEFMKGERAGTLVYAPFATRAGFQFSICASNFLFKIDKFFGAQDVETGDAAFDEKVIIKSDNENDVKRFLANARIRELLAALLSHGSFAGSFHAGGKPEGVAGKAEHIYFSCPGFIDDDARLKQIFELIVESLDRLIEMEITTPADVS